MQKKLFLRASNRGETFNMLFRDDDPNEYCFDMIFFHSPFDRALLFFFFFFFSFTFMKM